jgi:chromosome segregation ATPase
MQVEWKAVGVVSRKYSDELWKQFSAACDQFFNAMRENKKVERENYQKRKEAAKAQFAKKLEHMNDAQKLYRMRDNLQQEIKTAENNILFFTSKSKTANKLVDDMQRKIDELKKQLADIQEKINQAED